MFFKKSNRIQDSIDTLIGADTRIEGNVHFTGGLRVDGVVRGNVTEPNASPSTLISVSYTHLDVYKRQGLHRVGVLGEAGVGLQGSLQLGGDGFGGVDGGEDFGVTGLGQADEGSLVLGVDLQQGSQCIQGFALAGGRCV